MGGGAEPDRVMESHSEAGDAIYKLPIAAICPVTLPVFAEDVTTESRVRSSRGNEFVVLMT